MAISYLASGAWTAVAGTPLVPALPTGLAAGNMMVMFVHCKPYTVVPSTPTGWTQLFSDTEGAVASGTDAGSIRSAGYYREWISGDAAPSVTLTGSSVAVGIIHRYGKLFAAWHTPIGGFGGFDTAGTAVDITAAGVSDIASGDVVVGSFGKRSDAGTQSGQSFTATDATFGAATERVADVASTLGQDIGASGADAACTAGPASDDVHYLSTLTASHTGSGGVIRLREGVSASRSLQKVYSQAVQTASGW